VARLKKRHQRKIKKPKVTQQHSNRTLLKSFILSVFDCIRFIYFHAKNIRSSYFIVAFLSHDNDFECTDAQIKQQVNNAKMALK